MKQRTEYLATWIDREAMERDYPDAARKDGYSDADIRRSEGFLDVCPPEYYGRERKFPSLDAAKKWAHKNRSLDTWESPRAIVRVVTPATYDEPEDYEDTEVWSCECGKFERIDA